MRVFAPIATLRRRISGTAVLAFATLGLGACLDLGPKEACTVTIAPTTITLSVNQRVPVVGTAFDCDGNSIRDKKISFSTADASIATVSAEGSVIGIAPGQTTVSAVANGKSGTAQVTVTTEQANEITVNPPSATIRLGETIKPFTPTVKNAQGIVITRAVSWSSSNSAVANVDATGTITALSLGSTNIVLRADQVTTSAVVNVTPVRLISCSLAPNARSMTVTAQFQPTLTARDSAGANAILLGRPFVWTSNDETVASVSNTGVITARKAGTARITASSAEYPSVNCVIDVTAADATVRNVLITQRGGFLRLGVPRVFQALVIDSLDRQIPDRPPTWTTDTPGIISVSPLGVVTPNALGTARIIARADDKADTVSMEVTRVPLRSIRLFPAQQSIFEGTSQTFTATVEDSTGRTVTDRSLQWFTNNPTLAQITANANTQSAVVRGIAPGVVTVTALSDEFNINGQAQLLIVQTPIDTIIAPETFSIRVGQNSAFTITLRDAQGNELRNRRVSTVSVTPGVAAVPNAETNTTTVFVQGVSVGETTVRLQGLNINGQAEGKLTLVRVIVTAPTTGGN